MAPLAGKPPFATDEPDSYYEVPKATPRLRQPKPADLNARTSAYDVYVQVLFLLRVNSHPVSQLQQLPWRGRSQARGPRWGPVAQLGYRRYAHEHG